MKNLNWKATLDIHGVWELTKDKDEDEITFEETSKLCDCVITGLKKIKPLNDEDKIDNLIIEFEELKENCNPDYYKENREAVEEFNYLMEELYDWGDTNKRCWIKTLYN